MAHSDRVVRLIGAAKLAKAISLVAIGIGALELMRPEIADHVRAWTNAGVIERLIDRDPKQLEHAGIGCFIYAVLFGTEGTGLVLRKRWAEFLTIFITGSFVPFEIYELVQKHSAARAIVLVLNIAIVIYLVWHVRATTKHGEGRHAQRALAGA